MADSDRGEKLALARKKLKEFELKRGREVNSSPALSHGDDRVLQSGNTTGRESTTSNLSTSIVDGGYRTTLSGDHKNTVFTQPHSQSSSQNGSNAPGMRSTEDFVHIAVDDAVGEEVHFREANDEIQNFSNPSVMLPLTPSTHSIENSSQLLEERNQAVAAYETVKAQIAELHSHYTQLHVAYSQLSASGVHSEAEKQILQLQSALSVMVEEKAAVQAELRQLKENKMAAAPGQNSADSHNEGDIEARQLRSRLGDAEQMVNARSRELDSVRKDCALARAELLTCQHERSETKARLKSVLLEKEQLERDVQTIRKDLHMKEIYLKQLGAHNVNGPLIVDEDQIKSMQDRLELLTRETEVLAVANETLRTDAIASKRQWESMIAELAEKNRLLTNQLEDCVQSRDDAESRSWELNQQLQLLAKDMNKTNESLSPNAEVEASKDAMTVCETEGIQRMDEAVRKAVSEWRDRLEKETQTFRDEIQARDREILEQKQLVEELKIRFRGQEERLHDSTANQSEMLSLAEQLHNEKTTVSRAVAQNRELKEQLIETEDRVIRLTEEKLQSELARQTAEHQVKELNRKLENTASSDVLTTKGDNGPPRCGFEIASSIESSHADALSAMERVPQSPEGSGSGHAESAEGRVPSFVASGEDSPHESCENDPDSGSAFVEEGGVEVDNEEKDRLREELTRTQRQLNDVRQELQRSITQNEEINHIMVQNAQDENQNSFHVELGQAIARINSLVDENHMLQQELSRISVAQTQMQVVDTRDSQRECANEGQIGYSEEPGREINVEPDFRESSAENGGHEVPANSTAESGTPEVADHDDSVGSLDWARRELESRFEKAMRRNAQMEEDMERLEHINTQLQLENDTIADHVILYQHQRRLIRERLKVKDQQLATLDAERTKTVERCQELQRALMQVLNQSGALKTYETEHRALKRKTSRSYSHSTVDELSGDEDVVVDGVRQEVPCRESVIQEETNGLQCKPDAEQKSETSELRGADGDIQKSKSAEENKTSNNHSNGKENGRGSPRAQSINEQDAAVQRILQIITDISTPVPAMNEKLHCTQCIGDLQHL